MAATVILISPPMRICLTQLLAAAIMDKLCLNNNLFLLSTVLKHYSVRVACATQDDEWQLTLLISNYYTIQLCIK